MRQALAITLALLGALACGVAQAQWKWRDAQGQVHASDLPPPHSVPDKDIMERPIDYRRRLLLLDRPAPASAPASAPGAQAGVTKPHTDPELEARRRRAAEEQVAQQRQQEKAQVVARVENCSRARAALAGLESGQRMVRTNAQGEREVLDDRTRADEMQRARAVIASDCR